MNSFISKYDNAMNNIDVEIYDTEIEVEKQFVVIVGINKDNTIAYVLSRDENRMWEFPGGAIEKGETVIEAAIREFKEETGFLLLRVHETLTLVNKSHTTGAIDSIAVVLVGIVDENNHKVINDKEIDKCEFFSEVPETTTFNRCYLEEVLRLSLEKYAVYQNSNMWNNTGSIYEMITAISEDDVHYGPLLPGESTLKILPDLNMKDVLELGCGAGHNLIALSKLGAKRVIGIDFCESQIDILKEHTTSNIEAIFGDFSSAQYFNEAQYDLILSVFAFSFIPNLKTMFLNISNALKKGGCVIISTDHPLRKIEKAQNESGKVIGNLRYWDMPSKESIPYLHYHHSKEEFIFAIQGAGLVLEEIIEPQVLPLDQLEKAPYFSDYYKKRYKELEANPYTIIYKAKKC